MSDESPGALSINTATTRRQWGVVEAAENYARLGVTGIAPWRDQIAECGLASAIRAIRDNGLRVTGLCRGGMFPQPDRTSFAANLDDNRRAIAEAHELSSDCLVLVCGGLPEGSRDIEGARAMVAEAIALLLPEAQAAGVRLAIEPLHPMYAADRNCINTLGQALTLCEKLAPEDPNGWLGVALDVYHVWWDPALEDMLNRLDPVRLHAFHICDWRRTTRDLLCDRAMMGDGVIDIERIARNVGALGFEGLPEVEIFSNDWWAVDPCDVVATCLERSLAVRRILDCTQV
ncbi:MAG: sugar phosphate isomerase/epimerase family protein [Silicimonas sp.]